VRLRRAGSPASFAVPNVTVEGAAIESGRVSIRRSPLLDIRTVSTHSVGRTDFVLPDPKTQNASSLDNPLGLRPYEAYQFASSPFAIGLTASPIDATVRAEVRSILKLSDESRNLESMVSLEVRDRPIFAVEMLLPEDFELGGLDAPGSFQWSLDEPKETKGARRRLSIFFADGQQGGVPIVLRGKFLGQPDKDGIRLPRLDVLGVEQQRGDLAVQVDPSFDVKAKNLKGCETVLLQRLFGWLRPEQRELTRLALHFDSPNYDGRLVLSRREPRVSCATISNVRVTQRALEETILLDFTIREAGIRRVEFVLPHWMRDARVNVPLLRRKIVAAAKPGEPVRVTLELQDEVIDQLRVLIENDRLLDDQLQTAPIPVVLTGATSRQFVTLESAGRDEVMVDEDRTTSLEPLSRAQSQWKTLAAFLGERITRAYLVVPGAKDPTLAFKVFQRDAVVTAGARIGLAETDLVVDANGAYRGRTVYHMDNTTEQFLPIELPRGARLWSAQVAGEPVKPIKDINAADQRHVRIPLVKTSAGELDYQIVLVYGGRMSPIAGLAGKVDFPLPRTLDPKPDVSLTPELSQVRLHLPKTHRWFDFDGTMRRVEDEGQLAAGQLAYQEKVVSRLSETMRAGDEFAKARAAYNIQTMEDSFQQIQAPESSAWQGQEVQRQQAAAMRAFGEARQQAEIVVKESLETVDLSNRARLNERVVEQQVKRSRGNVMQAGKNWAGAEEKGLNREEGRKAAVGFDAQWFDRNSLVQPQRQEEAAPMGATPAQKKPARQPKTPAAEPGPSASGQPAVPSVPPIQLELGLELNAELKKESVKKPAFPAANQPAEKAESQLSKMARYQQRLRGTEQAEREGAVPKGAPVLYPSTSPSDP
ncbi:MAG: hypothetical protein GX621_02705, partial [Pirellulaceae bacterium]|nr:hypothetical protein [Pirellulaceae bacterium]